MRHLDLMIEYFGEGIACREMRKHLMAYIKGIPGSSRAKNAIFFSLLRKAIINAPLTVILPIWRGSMGVFAAEAVSQLVGGLASSLTMYVTVYRPLRREIYMEESRLSH